jgi:hypothetical protein
MEQENDIYQQEIQLEEDDDLMPDGYAEGDDFFNPESWTGGDNAEGASAEEPAEGTDGTQVETGNEGAPATERPEGTGLADTGGDPDSAPATGSDAIQPTKRRVRYQFDHEDREEEIDDADLPELLQKARSVDRYKQRLDSAQSLQDRLSKTAKALKYDSGEAFLDAILENARASEMDALRSKGVPDELAEDYIGRKYAGTDAVKQEEAPAAQSPDGRDYTAEARELLSVHPELRGKELPAEVYAAASQPGVSLLQAYTEHERKVNQAEAVKARDEADRLRKENRILKNNADSADRAPVTGVAKGGRAEDISPDDPFLKGFNSIW